MTLEWRGRKKGGLVVFTRRRSGKWSGRKIYVEGKVARKANVRRAESSAEGKCTSSGKQRGRQIYVERKVARKANVRRAESGAEG